MILIADAGSSKTSWALLQEPGPLVFETSGINPYFYTRDEISHKLLIEFPNNFDYSAITDVRFFGSGCSVPEKIHLVHEALAGRFPKASVHVAHDLLGAAIALCKDQPGIACILGTGSNSCYFDGSRIVRQVAAPGFILGDEGSGAYIGKKLVLDFLRYDVPDHLRTALIAIYSIDEGEILRRVYNEKDPNKFLAGFVPFLSEHIGEAYCATLVQNCFRDFFNSCIARYPEREHVSINFTGSVAFHFSGILRAVLEENGCRMGIIARQPIDELIEFYGAKTGGKP